MKLILSGGGAGDASKDVDSLFTSLLLNPTVLYIPIAMFGRKEYPYPSCLEWCNSWIKNYGDIKVTMWTEKDLENFSYEELSKFGGIYIGGGNTFYLLSKFREFGFDKGLVKILTTTEMPIAGGSAGALIFTDTIETCTVSDTNDIGLKDISGLKQTKGFNLAVHYEKRMDEIIMGYTRTTNSKIIAIPEDSGLFINDKVYNYRGSK